MFTTATSISQTKSLCLLLLRLWGNEKSVLVVSLLQGSNHVGMEFLADFFKMQAAILVSAVMFSGVLSTTHSFAGVRSGEPSDQHAQELEMTKVALALADKTLLESCIQHKKVVLGD